MNKKEKILAIKEVFDSLYPDAECSLDFTTPHELLVAVQLSAQCTDARVNIVTKTLFERYTSPMDFATADEDELAQIIRSCGFYRTKAKNIIASSKDIVEKFGGKVPDTMEDLTSLAGVGRKTANLILGDVYGKPAVVVDTHAIRLSNRIGLTTNKDPVKIEYDLKKIVPSDYQSRFCHQLVHHGRAVCNARKPGCGECGISHLCKYNKGDKANEQN
ncbi:MAG: endonuclease III [Ruminococcaceae bacterium]|nr:endonuclease III [Oscillospiraceae bacterium]